MIGIADILRWLFDTSAACAALLLLAYAAMLLIRQPARRLRIAEFALAGCLILTLVQAVPATRFSLGIVNVGRPVRLPWLDDTPMASPTPMPAAPRRSSATVAPAAAAPPRRGAWHPSDLLQYWRETLLALYTAGAIVMTARLAAALLALRRLARRAAPPAQDLADLWQHLTRHTARPIRLAISPALDRPITFAMRRPVVLLPAAIAAAPRRDLIPILRHELGHIERRDAAAWLLAAAVNVLLFFLPPLWLLKRQMRLAQEYLADYAAADSAPLAYSETLLRLVKLTAPASALRPAPALALGAWRAPWASHDLLLRIRHLLNLRHALETRCTRRWTLAVALAMLLATGILGAFTLADTSLASQVRTSELKGVKFLLARQNAAGGWLTGLGPAPTALVVRSLLQAGVPADHPAILAARRYIDSCRQSDGGYYTDGEPTYHTAVVLSMYAAFSDADARARLAAGEKFLQRELAAANPPAGQWYASPPASNDPGAPAPTAFHFADPSERAADAVLDTYGSLTYARWKSMVYAGLKESDPRTRQATRWLQRHWTLDKHPGTGSAEGLYYYYLAAAKTLNAANLETLPSPAGLPHLWRDELDRRLLSAQSPDGSWVNRRSPRWLEDRPEIVTAYALLALQETRK